MLNTNEVRARAAEFARDWKDARYERGEAQSFYNEFFNVFGMKRHQYAVLLTITARLVAFRKLARLYARKTGAEIAKEIRAGELMEICQGDEAEV